MIEVMRVIFLLPPAFIDNKQSMPISVHRVIK